MLDRPGTQTKQVNAGDFGCFIASTGEMTIGKVVARVEGEVTLQVFRSPVAPEFDTISVPSESVKGFTVPPQTLVYQRRTSHWAMGRSLGREALDYFAVRFPNEGKPVPVPKSELFVRSPRVDDDPTDLLAAQVTSSPYFTEARHRLCEFVASQRATYRGLTALATAAIELYGHQLAAVNRVLSDPVHRYLLADEVGLGKTIEAGLLIAQHLI